MPQIKLGIANRKVFPLCNDTVLLFVVISTELNAYQLCVAKPTSNISLMINMDSISAPQTALDGHAFIQDF